jgi:hypothetical protein
VEKANTNVKKAIGSLVVLSQKVLHSSLFWWACFAAS